MFDAWIVKYKPFVSASVLIVLFEITTKHRINTYLDHGKLSWNNLTPRFRDSLSRKWHKNHKISADICPGILPEVTGNGHFECLYTAD